MNEVGHLLRICGHVLAPDDLSAFAAFAAAGRGRITGCQLGGAGNGATLEHRWRTGITAHADGEYTVTVPADTSEPLPLADALAAALPHLFPTATSAKRACRRKGGAHGVLLADGSEGRCDRKVRGGETFRVVGRRPSGSSTMQLAVVLEEDTVAVVHKPPGMVMYGDGPSTLHGTLTRVLPGAVPVHRLDAPTEGLVVCARTSDALRDLGRQFETRVVRKRYRAVVHGNPAAEAGTVDAPVDGRRGENASLRSSVAGRLCNQRQEGTPVAPAQPVLNSPFQNSFSECLIFLTHLSG